MADNPPIEELVSTQRIIELFNTSQHRTPIENGAYREDITTDKVIKDETAQQKGFPIGTRSQYLKYFDLNGQWVVGMHRYILPSGKIGASGKADPKRVLIGNVWYLLEQSKKVPE